MKCEKVKDTEFRFKEFTVSNRYSAMKVGTDGVLLGAWALHGTGFVPSTIVDAGTGTGVIALLMAQRFTEAQIIGVEIDSNASEEATRNFTQSSWTERLTCRNVSFGDFCRTNVPNSVKADLLISNPPFFRNGQENDGNSRTLARHEGTLSPVALLREAPGILSSCGRLCFVSTDDSRKEIEFEAALAGLKLERRTAVSTGEGKPPRRILWQFAMKGAKNVKATDNTLTIRYRGGAPTPEYQRLVEPYYLYVK